MRIKKYIIAILVILIEKTYYITGMYLYKPAYTSYLLTRMREESDGLKLGLVDCKKHHIG